MSARQERDWRLYADDILQACAKVRHIVSGMTYETFVADEIRVDATLRNIEIIVGGFHWRGGKGFGNSRLPRGEGPFRDPSPENTFPHSQVPRVEVPVSILA